MEPALQGTPIAGAFVQDEGFMVDTEAYLNALLTTWERAASRCACTRRRSESRTRARAWRSTPVGHLESGRLIVAAGAWSGNLPGLTPLPVKPQRGQMLTVFHPTVRLTRIVSGPTYLAPWRAGEVVVGATEEDVGFACHTTPGWDDAPVRRAGRLAPALREARVTRTWAGLRSTRRRAAAASGATRAPATLIASGHGGQGILTGGSPGARWRS